MKKIRIKCGCEALVDDDMYPVVSRFKWRNAHGYAVRSLFYPGENLYRNWGMHHEVLPPKPGMFIDHIDGNPLNNQRNNLRYATHVENGRSQKKPKHNTSGYKGVSWLERDKRWIAWISVDARNRYIGSFTTAVEAAYYYNQKAVELYGEFARLNPIPEDFTPSEGVRVKRRSDNQSGYVGAMRTKQTGQKWISSITVDGHRVHLGTFDDPAEAAYVYDQVALQLFGSRARLNFL